MVALNFNDNPEHSFCDLWFTVGFYIYSALPNEFHGFALLFNYFLGFGALGLTGGLPLLIINHDICHLHIIDKLNISNKFINLKD